MRGGDATWLPFAVFDPFTLCVTLGPIALYLALLGRIYCGKRPVILTGVRDVAALWIALSGVVLLGPVERLLPVAATNNYGRYTWLLVAALYGLCVAFGALLGRPRLVVYNITPDALRPALAALLERLEPEARWAGSCVVLPKLGIEFFLEPHAAGRCVTLAGTLFVQNLAAWRRLERGLAAELRGTSVGQSFWGPLFLAIGVAAAVPVAWSLARYPTEVALAARQFLGG